MDELDLEALKFLNRMARYYANWAIHDKLPMNLENPRRTFLVYSSKYINKYIDNREFPHYEDSHFYPFITSCAMLRTSGDIKDVVVELWSMRRNGVPSEEDMKEFRLSLEGER